MGFERKRKSKKSYNWNKKTLNTLPMNTLGHIGSFMTGVRGSVNQQENKIKKTIGKRKTRKVRKSTSRK